MANNPFYSDTAIAGASGALATICTLLNSGKIQIRSGGQVGANTSLTGTLLATLTFSATAFGTPTASGTDFVNRAVTATANSITSGTGTAGTAGYFALLESNNSTVIATGSVGTSGADLNISPSLTIANGATVSCTGFTITQVE